MAYCDSSLLAPLAVGSILSMGKGRPEKLLSEVAGLEIKLRDSVSQDLAPSDGLYCPYVLNQIRSISSGV